MVVRPSSLPMLAQCPRFERGATEDFTDLGTERHEALADVLRSGDQTKCNALEEDDAEGVRWAVDYIKLSAPSEHPMRMEQHVNPLDSDFNPIFENGGTADIICGAHLFDFKWRERNYDAQMAAYALALFDEGWPEVTVHVLFGATKRAVKYKLDEDSARALVSGVIALAKDPSSEPSPCDYCGWCANRLRCKPYTRVARRVAEGYADEPLLSQVKNWHPSEMQTAEEIALGLTIARKLLAPWCKSMEHHAKEAAIKRGLKLRGYKLKEKAGKTHVSDVARAHEILALPVADFLKCCDLRMNTSKEYPDRTGVVDIYARVKEVKKTPAAREVKQKLSEIITNGKSSLSLVAIGGEAEETEE